MKVYSIKLNVQYMASEQMYVLLSSFCLLLCSVSICTSKTVFSFLSHCIPEWRLLRLKVAPPSLYISIVKNYEQQTDFT